MAIRYRERLGVFLGMGHIRCDEGEAMGYKMCKLALCDCWTVNLAYISNKKISVWIW